MGMSVQSGNISPFSLIRRPILQTLLLRSISDVEKICIELAMRCARPSRRSLNSPTIEDM
jgi:hypothetical protein